MAETATKMAPEPGVVEGKKISFNYNKLQATLCILASATLSISLIAWAIASLFK